MNKKYLLLLILPFLAFGLHKEYYSLTKIDYNAKEHSLQITTRLFVDDMELALSNQFNKTIELNTKKEIENADILLDIYLKQRFKISINDQDITYNFIGKEFEKDIMYIYLEITNIQEIKKINIINTVLFDSFPEQENIVKINYLNKHNSLILNQDNKSEYIIFK